MFKGLINKSIKQARLRELYMLDLRLKEFPMITVPNIIEALETDGENPVSNAYKKSTKRITADLTTKDVPRLFCMPNKKLINT
jgi:hypothetical protein